MIYLAASGLVFGEIGTNFFLASEYATSAYTPYFDFKFSDSKC